MKLDFQRPLDTNKVYYLASPYSHKSKAVIQQRYEAVDEAGALLCFLGFVVIEPIAMCHNKSLKFDLPSGYEYWKTRDRKFVALCDGLIVLTLPGWKESIGVSDEIQTAKVLGKEIHYLSLEQIRALDQDSFVNRIG